MIPIGKDELVLLKELSDLVELIRSHGYPLKPEGRKGFKGRCPYPEHVDKTPSFHVDAGRKTYKCFGCGKHGDAITFLREVVGLSFLDALQDLRGRYGNGAKSPASTSKKPDREATSEKGATPPTPPTPPAPASAPTLSDPERAQLLDAYAKHCESALERSTTAQRYLAGRGLFVPEILKALRIGYADGSVVKAIAPDGEQRRKLTELGVLLPNGTEAMLGMIVVPLLDLHSGAVLQFYGRAVRHHRHHYLPGELRGLVNGAVAAGSESLVLVESVLDAVSLLVLGIPNVLPLYGTNGWKADHEEVLAAGNVKSVTLLLDSDEAGRRASESLGERLAGRGLAVRIAALPPVRGADGQTTSHKDPNAALQAGVTADEMRETLAQALAIPSPFATLAPTEPTEPTEPTGAEPRPSQPVAKYEVEELADGFKLTVGQHRYWARGIRGVAGERLEMTIRLEDGYSQYIDRVDLCNGRSRRGFALRAARRFRLDEDLIERELMDLLYHQGEAWLATRAEAEEDDSHRPKAPELSEEDKAEALAFLRDKNLLDLTVQHLTRLGYVGEETNKVLGYLVVISRKLADPLSAVVLSQSAAGKSGLTSLLEKITPPEDVKFFSRLTPAALYYMEQDELVRKVVIIEERSGSDDADYSIRTLQSRKKLVIGFPRTDPRTGKTKTHTREVDGPAVFLQTTTALDLSLDNLTRCFELYLDESEEQTRRIHDYQRGLKTLAGKREVEEAARLLGLHWNVQRLLQPVEVVIPWSQLLTFPTRWIRTRRDDDRFLHLIEASAFYHQYQRPSAPGTPPGTVIEAVEDDYAIAYNLAAHLLGSTLSDVKKPARDLLETMQELVAKLALERGLPPERVVLTRRELREATGLPDLQVWRLLRELVSLEHVELVRGGPGKLCLYRPVVTVSAKSRIVPGLLTPAELHQLLKKWQPEAAQGQQS